MSSLWCCRLMVRTQGLQPCNGEFDSPQHHYKMNNLTKELCERGRCVSMSEARRLLFQKVVKVNGKIVTEDKEVSNKDSIQIGKKCC